MILYLDTSALLKIYVDEHHADVVRRYATRAAVSACHLITYTETRSALAGKLRKRQIDTNTLAACVAELDRTWSYFEHIDVFFPLIRHAGELAERFGLRGFDALHLASAKVLYESAGDQTAFFFACFDSRLNAAASQLDIPLIRID
ncbi:type II toxin-antitoxin system VapC family toxin [Endothiovibrio diazotrophicus]